MIKRLYLPTHKKGLKRLDRLVMFDWVKKELRDFNKISPVLNASALKEPLNADVAFIGAGLSSTFTLIELIKEINLQELVFEKRNLKIGLRMC